MAGGEHIYIKWIKQNLASDSTILEFGSGQCSTKQLSEAGFRMVSIEHDKRYIGKYSSTYIHAPLKNLWYDVNFINNLPKYDLILVDGPVGVGNRNRLGFYYNIKLFDVSVPIIIHDAERSTERELAEKVSKYTGRPYQILDETVSPGQSILI